MIDPSELKVGDKVVGTSSNGPYEVTAIGQHDTFLYYDPHRWREELGRWPTNWRKVEPPLIDPEQVWYQYSGSLHPIENLKNDPIRATFTAFRITGYEVVDGRS